MKYFILISVMAVSIEAQSSTPLEQEKITGCERYNAVYESLNKECNPEAIRVLIKKLDTPFEEKLASGDKTSNCKSTIERPGKILSNLAAKKFCPEALDMISKKVSAKDYAEVIKDGFSEEYFKEILQMTERNRGAKENSKDDMNKINQMIQTMKIITNKSMEDCKKGEKESCETLKDLIKLQEKLNAATEEDCKKGNKESCSDAENKEQTDEEYLNSPKYIIDQACPMKFELERYETILKNEKEVGKISGAVNAKTLRNTGAMIVMIKPKLEQWKKAYLKKTKHNIELKKCNKADYFETP